MPPFSKSKRPDPNLTSQLFFDETTTAAVYKTTYYASHGTKGTANTADMVYESTNTSVSTDKVVGPELTLSLTGSTTAGYAATFVLGMVVS